MNLLASSHQLKLIHRCSITRLSFTRLSAGWNGVRLLVDTFVPLITECEIIIEDNAMRLRNYLWTRSSRRRLLRDSF